MPIRLLLNSRLHRPVTRTTTASTHRRGIRHQHRWPCQEMLYPRRHHRRRRRDMRTVMARLWRGFHRPLPPNMLIIPHLLCTTTIRTTEEANLVTADTSTAITTPCRLVLLTTPIIHSRWRIPIHHRRTTILYQPLLVHHRDRIGIPILLPQERLSHHHRRLRQEEAATAAEEGGERAAVIAAIRMTIQIIIGNSRWTFRLQERRRSRKNKKRTPRERERVAVHKQYLRSVLVYPTTPCITLCEKCVN